jgi:hypothetical protein
LVLKTSHMKSRGWTETQPANYITSLGTILNNLDLGFLKNKR